MDDVDSAVADSRGCSPAQYSFVLLGLLGRLGDLAWSRRLLLHSFNDAHCHRLTHVTYSKASWEKETKQQCDFFTFEEQLNGTKRQEESPYREEGTRRSSPHTWACPGPCPQWQRHQIWAIWDCPLASSLNDGQSFPSAQQTCRRCGPCGSPALEHNQHWSGLGGSGWWPSCRWKQ